LFKFKEGESFNHRNTLSISRINPPKFGGGLKFELTQKLGKKRDFSKVSQKGYKKPKLIRIISQLF